MTPTTETAVATVQASAMAKPQDVHEFEMQQRQASLFARSGLFADIKGQSEPQAIAQAFVKVALGASMGFSPAEAMTGIDIIQGRVAVGANLRAARMQRAGYTWKVVQLDPKGCILEIRKGNEVLGVSSFMEEDAQKSGLLGKDNYKKNPRNMYFARAITNAQRWYAPGVLGLDIPSTEEAVDVEYTVTPVAEATAMQAAALRERLAAAQSKSEEPETAEVAA